MKPKVTPEQWEEAKKWLAEGITQTEVALRLGCKQPLVSLRLGKRKQKTEAVPGTPA